MLTNIDRLSAQIATLDTMIELAITPFTRQVQQLAQITGAGPTDAQEIIAEVGVDTSRFPSAAHLVSWAKFCPQTHESAGKRKNNGRVKGDPWLAAALGNMAATAARNGQDFLGARHQRIARRRGPQKAIVATGNAILTIVNHLLSDPAAQFQDLGADYFTTRIDKNRGARSLAAALLHSRARTLT